MVWQCCSSNQQNGGALFHSQWEYYIYASAPHLLVEGRWGDRSLCVFSFRIVHNLPCAQIDSSLQFDFQLEYTSPNSFKTVYSLYFLIVQLYLFWFYYIYKMG
jgi:hypothetical protein